MLLCKALPLFLLLGIKLTAGEDGESSLKSTSFLTDNWFSVNFEAEKFWMEFSHAESLSPTYFSLVGKIKLLLIWLAHLRIWSFSVTLLKDHIRLHTVHILYLSMILLWNQGDHMQMPSRKSDMILVWLPRIKDLYSFCLHFHIYQSGRHHWCIFLGLLFIHPKTS